MLDDIVFYGDPHGDFDTLTTALDRRSAAAVVIVGDFDAPADIAQTLRRHDARVGGRLFWIPGNHDTDSLDAYRNTFGGGFADRNINARVVDIAGVRIGGLGGVFRQQVWNPKVSEPRFPTRASMEATMTKNTRFEGGISLKHRSSIFWEDVQALAKQQCDVLVTHEAPDCLDDMGFEVIDELAHAMGAQFVVHGHHHSSYRAELRNGVHVAGLERAEVMWGDEMEASLVPRCRMRGI